MKLGSVFFVLVVLLTLPVAADEDRWQASATGLTEAPLCSLVLRASWEDSVQLATRGGVHDAGWSRIGRCAIPLGQVTLPGEAAPKEVQTQGDWSGARLEAHFADGAKLCLIASRLSPGILIETMGSQLRLWGGTQQKMVSLADGEMKIHSLRHRHNPPADGTITPTYLAAPDTTGVKVFSTSGAIDLPSARPTWLLVWWGRSSHFASTDSPLLCGHGNWHGIGRHQDAYQADLPMLVVFSEPPIQVKAASDGGLDLAFHAAGGRVIRAVVMPLLGAHPCRAETTQQWSEALPEVVARRCAKLAEFARQYPVSVRESFVYDAAKDEATFRETVQFVEVGSGGKKLAPLPPMVAMATQEGLGITTSGDLVDTGIVTDFGPIIGTTNVDVLTWSIHGLKKYAERQENPRESGSAPADLKDELAVETKRMLAAGLLAPWNYTDHLPCGDVRGEYYWGEPGEVLCLLAEVYPALPRDLQTKLANYLARLRRTYPPESQALIPADEGTRRGGYDQGPCRVSERITQERGGRVTLFALYGLERYCTIAGEEPDTATWNACKQVLADAFLEQAWDTLYLLGHPNRVRAGEQFFRQRDLATASWRGDRPGAVANANRQFAGAVGAVRLARLMDDEEAQQQAWWLLARSVLLRYAMGKYAPWRYRTGLAVIPESPDWYWTFQSGAWQGVLETDDWSQPAHDVRQLVELAPDLVSLGDWVGASGDDWRQTCSAQLGAFRFMVPELARFITDHLKPECAALVERIEWNQPIWYVSFAEAILGAEHNMNHPSDAYQVFLARAWILDEKPERLTQWIDVPWVQCGDLFHLVKLAETIKSYRASE